MRRRRAIPLLTIAVLIVVFVSAGACKKKAPTTTEQARPPAEAPAPGREVRPPTTPRPTAVEPDVMSQDIVELNKKGYLKDAYFDYDKADLRDEARTTLAADAEWLKRYPAIQFLIEGHCDERGTAEYNLALGDRRANAARDYLASLGVDASRIRTVSYGKERPFCTDSNESCWQQNRRAHFLITGK